MDWGFEVKNGCFRSSRSDLPLTMFFLLKSLILREMFFILRMYGITNAPLEVGHNWRQSLTNMIARNFIQIDNNILYPRIDVDGNKSGIMATEFPLFNYLIYLVCFFMAITNVLPLTFEPSERIKIAFKSSDKRFFAIFSPTTSLSK